MILNRTQQALKATLISFILIVVSAGAAQGSGSYRLTSLSVKGSKRYTSSQAAPATGLKLGEQVNFAGLTKAANRLADTGFFSTIDFNYKTQGGTVSVTYTVQDAKKVMRCHFANFVWFTRQQLMQDLRAHIPLFQGSVPAAGNTLKDVEAELQTMLAARGVHAQVSYGLQQQIAPDGRVIGGVEGVEGVEFMAIGVAIPVQKLEFSGAPKGNLSQLKEIFHPLLHQNYDARAIENMSNKALGQLYLEHGYLQAKVGPPVVRVLPGSSQPNSVAVTIPVSAGEQFKLKGIAWAGQSAIPYKKLAGSLHARVGRPLNEAALQQEALGLNHLFHRIGYVRADISPKPLLHPATHTVVYQIKIEQGPLYHMGALQIAGVDSSHARALQRMCPLHSGDAFNTDVWKKFLKKAFNHLPPSSTGWKVQQAMKFNDSQQTVNVRLTFSPA